MPETVHPLRANLFAPIGNNTMYAAPAAVAPLVLRAALPTPAALPGDSSRHRGQHTCPKPHFETDINSRTVHLEDVHADDVWI
ncbi:MULTISPECIES: hypothetical protein [Streptomyces]|uniref:Uncharacterized protein n=1 Tax=Streptomyces yunnanensis TaxID=156453 RepID=A0ABY8ANI0_9ACTN|nr:MULTISPECIES: hypothetical protein [Streptomyces]AJC52806.1 hypothetical protein GZL_00198 [Streptomyces sp. 769]WEB45420.1 hypothetical protein MOV08_43155 [Streptomyces yunnanensis]